MTVLFPLFPSKTSYLSSYTSRKFPESLTPLVMQPSVGEDLPEEGQKENQNWPQREDVWCWKTGKDVGTEMSACHTPTSPQLRAMG